MIAHQVITGALNKGENVYSLGNIEGITFTACAVGSDVVILGSNFDRVQIIPDSSQTNKLVTSVSCCQETGKIAVTYGNVARIFEASTKSNHEKNVENSIFQYTWVETNKFTVKGHVSSVLWNTEGSRMLFVIGNELMLYQHRSVSSMYRASGSSSVVFAISEEDVIEAQVWEVIWKIRLSQTPKYINYSPDGAYLATAGENDRIIKLFYQEHSDSCPDQISFSFLLLHHPAAVRGFEWRKTGRYMPRKCVQATLITWCVDNTSRIWKETPPPELAIIDLTGDGNEPSFDRLKSKKKKYINMRKTKAKIMNKLKVVLPEKKRRIDESGLGLRAQIGKSPSFSDLIAANVSQTSVQFHLAATVNAETDCLLVPSMETQGLTQKPLCVHWLNNKELVFSVGSEKLLAEAVMMETDNSRAGSQQPSLESSPECESRTNMNAEGSNETTQGTKSVCSTNSQDIPSSKDILDVKLEILLRQWSKSNDVLFTIHPIDGSLLTWTVEWLDDHHRQPVISYSSRLPNALPISDTVSLHTVLYTYNPHEPLYIDVLRRDMESKENELVNEKILERRVSNTIHALTSHDNGTLNLWHMTVDEGSYFSQILNITHISRMCGHRFKIKEVIAHPVLPLLLSTSQFQSNSQSGDLAMDHLSEVILWKIAPVGPLCKSGGVKELARVANVNREGFSSLSWIPAILPSCTLGRVCNSPSSCFIASDGKRLTIYQAVVDARGLLAELSNASNSQQNRKLSMDYSDDERHLTPSPRRSFAPSFMNHFNVVSTQSTAKPGCVLEIGQIEDSFLNGAKFSFMHVFPARLVVKNDDDEDDENRLGGVIDRSKTVAFCDEYFIVMVENSGEEDIIMMYSLTISSQQPEPIPNFDTESLPEDKGFLRPTTPITPSMAKLKFKAEMVCRMKFPMPEDTKITKIVPAAGHLSSSSLYPACETPYVLITSDSDDSIRFWKCKKNGTSYEWLEWNMINDGRSSELGIEGPIQGISAAHSGRLACAYNLSNQPKSSTVELAVFECESSGGVEWLREDTFTIRNFDTISKSDALTTSNRHSTISPELSHALNPRFFAAISTYPSDDLMRAIEHNAHHPHGPFRKFSLNDLVRLDWVSTEDGAHMLTVGVGAKIYIYTQASQDIAQQNVTLMKDSETSMRRPSLRKASSLLPNLHSCSRLTRWVCSRVLDLDSADGLPPVPTTLSWARDGLLVVGMQSEMRVYNQWNFASFEKPSESSMTRRMTNAQVVSLPVSTSHSMLDQMTKKRETMSTIRSRVFLDISGPSKKSLKDGTSQNILEAISSEGVFEAARLGSPNLPQYHPKQLIVLLNAGKTKRVKAILLHVVNCLKQRQGSAHNPLSRAASVRRMSTVDIPDNSNPTAKPEPPKPIDEDSLDYDEVDDVPPLPLYALLAADHDVSTSGENAEDVIQQKDKQGYDSLFSDDEMQDSDLDKMLNDSDSIGRRTRVQSCSSDIFKNEMKTVPTQFTAKHNRLLTEMLTHMHLPGLSSVDQMHLLAIADTLSHFTSDVMDKLAQANAAMKPVVQSVLGDSAAGGYATAAAGIETVDECGLRYLMAMKQHEFLLVCLPIKQRLELKVKGLASSQIIWAQHSETETELLNAIPGMQKANPTWDELRCLGIAWWLKNTSSLKICVEKLAKAAFQQNQEPMDAALYYLALRKKNVLTHLFKTARNKALSDFFMNDFTNPHWQKVAAKNAFVLMSKQRFHHAAAFFLLSGSLSDAIQTILCKCNDLQLALTVVRLYEGDIDKQHVIMKEILCREVLGITVEEFDNTRGKIDEEQFLGPQASKDPFTRSMAYWILKDYTRAAHTFLEEAQSDRIHTEGLSDTFNFYTFLRKHPLVMRQRLTDAGAQVGSTEKFIAVGKQLELIVTPPERRLFFRTAAEHSSKGCPMLALDVLSKLPKNISMVKDFNDALKRLLSSDTQRAPSPPPAPVNVDWSAPTQVVEKDELKLDWSDDEDEEVEENGVEDAPSAAPIVDVVEAKEVRGEKDIYSQHMKFVASLRILTDELSTLASGFEVDGGHLRFQLLNWLEREFEVLKENCDYHTGYTPEDADFEEEEESFIMENGDGDLPLHEALKIDRAEMMAKILACAKRRKWLTSNQKLIRCFTSFCALHSAQNHRLTSALMELLLLLLDVQKDSGHFILREEIPDMNTFPLLEASVSSTKMFVSSPLSFIENQCYDLLTTIAEMHDVPNMNAGLQKCYMLYNLSQGLSSCLYQSLCDVDQMFGTHGGCRNETRSGVLTKRTRLISTANDEIRVTTAPAKWPGVSQLIALLSREKEDDAPQLRLLLSECFVAITMSLFCFGLAAYDARWLYRLSAHKIDPAKFGLIFGGGGEKKLKTVPPARPPRPTAPQSNKGDVAPDVSSLRTRLNLRVFGPDSSAQNSSSSSVTHGAVETTIHKWVPPHKNIVQLYAEKPEVEVDDCEALNYDSDEEHEESVYESDDEEDRCENALPTSFAWQLMRLTLMEQYLQRLRDFLILAGYDPRDIPGVAPRIESVLKLLESWIQQQHQTLKNFAGGMPTDLLPDMTVDSSDQHLATTFKKYAVLTQKNNSPFENDDRKILPMRRLWTFLVNEESLQPYFIKYIFASQCQMEYPSTERIDILSGIESQELPEAYKIIQKNNEPIVAFACNQEKPGMIVVSNGRELQEMDITNVFQNAEESTSWVWNRADLDMHLIQARRDPLRDNDDYQLFTENPKTQNGQQKATNLLMKRNMSGVRRIDAHPSAPYYVTGSSDGSIKLWKWGSKEVVYTARVAGQHAKVAKISFSCNGNKFAAVDGDGMLCLWQASQSTEQRKPFFSQRCHNKSASDVRFLGHSSSVLVTAGSSSFEYNLGLWDTLLPQNRALVHTWVAHTEGATCAMYLPNQQTIVSGGRHGDICFWDVRQRQLRHTIKAFDPTISVKTLVSDISQDLIVAGSSEGDIKIWSADSNPQLMYALIGEHATRGGFSFRQVGQSTVQGVQQLFIDQNMRLFSCGADASLKFRTLPSVYNMTNLV